MHPSQPSSETTMTSELGSDDRQLGLGQHMIDSDIQTTLKGACEVEKPVCSSVEEAFSHLYTTGSIL
jgi:hypothetical protein